MLICIENNSAELLDAVFEIEGVGQEQRSELMIEMRIAIARATRPRWKEFNKIGRHPELRSAVRFLKKIHAADIHDGVVSTALIRAIDPHLMNEVESYISKRARRLGVDDLGDAAGLTLVLSRPPNARKRIHKNSHLAT